MEPCFLIVAPDYTHRSSGIRALYRLCHHLNRAGYPSAMLDFPGQQIQTLPDWDVWTYRGPVQNAVVVYPEVVLGNPYQARRVVRWALNKPGLLAGDKTYPPSEMVFAYDEQRLPDISAATGVDCGPNRVLWLGLVDPSCIYPDPRVEKRMDCSFTHKGRALLAHYPLPDATSVTPLEEITPDMAALGDALRRTRTLYSYDHYSNVLREAVISGCEVRVVSEEQGWHDPRTCRCLSNIRWTSNLGANYAAQFHDGSFVRGFILELTTRWPLPDSDPSCFLEVVKRQGLIAK